MRCLIGELIHMHSCQGRLDPGDHLLGWNTHVLQAERHIFLHNGGHDLVIRILKNHACPLANRQSVLILPGVHSAHGNRAFRWNVQGIDQFGQG